MVAGSGTAAFAQALGLEWLPSFVFQTFYSF